MTHKIDLKIEINNNTNKLIMNYNKVKKVDIIKMLIEAETKNQEMETKNQELKDKCDTYSNKYFEITKKYNMLVRDKDYKILYNKEQKMKEKSRKDYNNLVKRFETSVQNRKLLFEKYQEVENKSLEYIEFLTKQFNKVEKFNNQNTTKTIQEIDTQQSTFSKEFDEIQMLIVVLNYEFANL